MVQKKIPQRMCVGCQEMKNKKELIRIVRTPESEILLDPTGKKSGRGAYVCPCEACVTKAYNGGNFLSRQSVDYLLWQMLGILGDKFLYLKQL